MCIFFHLFPKQKQDKIIAGSVAVGRVYAWNESEDGKIMDLKCATGFYVSKNVIATSRHILNVFPSLSYPNKFSFLAADVCPSMCFFSFFYFIITILILLLLYPVTMFKKNKI